MERYRLLKEIGDGTCGCVYKALNTETKEIVAVKKMKRKFYSWQECMNLREVQSLCQLNHSNIVKLKEVVRDNHELFFIFEHMECNLYQMMRDRRNPFSEAEIRNFMSQVFQGLAYMHRNGYFHRDLKPENLLVTNDVIKIADFGLVRDVMSGPPYTDYVSTRWYRAPEVLLQSSTYTPAIDMWAMGAILAELFTLFPLFPGESEIDQIYEICTVLGAPDGNSWPEGMRLSQSINFKFFQFPPANLSDMIATASLEAIDLIQQLCSWDPLRRPTAEQALQHAFFHVVSWVPFPLETPIQSKISENDPKLELSLWDFGTDSDDCFLGLTLAVKPSVPDKDSAKHVQENRDEMLYCQGFEDHSVQSIFLPMAPPDNTHKGAVMASLTSSYLVNSQASLLALGISEPSEFNFSSLQPTLLDGCSVSPMMAVPSPFQQFFQ